MSADAAWDVALRPLCRAAFLLPGWRAKSSPWTGSRRRTTGSRGSSSSAGSACVYLVAFLVALNQFPALLGERGLLPGPRYLARTSASGDAPSLFHLRYSDRLSALVGWVGVVLAAATCSACRRPGRSGLTMLVWLVLWALYLSIVNVGQTLLLFGWESLLLEAGFLAIFLGNARTPPPLPVLLAVPLAAVPGGARRGAHQAARRSLLARPHLPRLPPRDPADAESAELVLPPAAAAGSTGSRCSATTSPSSSCRSLLFLPQPVAGVGAPGDHRHPGLADAERQLRLAQPRDHGARVSRPSPTRSFGRSCPARRRPRSATAGLVRRGSCSA